MLRQGTIDCEVCGCPRLATRKVVNHPVHLVLSAFTCGTWLLAYAIAACYAAAGGGWRCMTCGTPYSAPEPTVLIPVRSHA